MTNNIKHARIYPLQYRLSGTENSSENLFNIFKRENARNNLIKDFSYPMLLIIDRIRNNFVCGKFLKLREDPPSIINLIDGIERNISIADNENIIEITHFIMNTADKLLLTEYNFQAWRLCCNPLKTYLDKRFDTTDNEVLPIIDKDTFAKLEGEDIINTFRIKIANYNPEELERIFGYNVLRMLSIFSSNRRASIEVIARKGKSKEDSLNKEKTLEVAKQLKDSFENLPIESLKIEAKNSAYDLLNENFVSYKLDVSKNGRYLDTSDFYNKTINLYNDKIPILKSSLEEIT
jgi:hypothetical protein